MVGEKLPKTLTGVIRPLVNRLTITRGESGPDKFSGKVIRERPRRPELDRILQRQIALQSLPTGVLTPTGVKETLPEDFALRKKRRLLTPEEEFLLRKGRRRIVGTSKRIKKGRVLLVIPKGKKLFFNFGGRK